MQPHRRGFATPSLCDGGVDRVVIDLRRVTFVDSYGLGTIVASKKRLSGERNSLCVVVEEAQTSIRRVFAITGLDRVLPVHATVDEAVSDCLAEAVE